MSAQSVEAVSFSAGMVYLAWDEFISQAEALYRAAPLEVLTLLLIARRGTASL